MSNRKGLLHLAVEYAWETGNLIPEAALDDQQLLSKWVNEQSSREPLTFSLRVWLANVKNLIGDEPPSSALRNRQTLVDWLRDREGLINQRGKTATIGRMAADYHFQKGILSLVKPKGTILGAVYALCDPLDQYRPFYVGVTAREGHWMTRPISHRTRGRSKVFDRRERYDAIPIAPIQATLDERHAEGWVIPFVVLHFFTSTDSNATRPRRPTEEMRIEEGIWIGYLKKMGFSLANQVGARPSEVPERNAGGQLMHHLARLPLIALASHWTEPGLGVIFTAIKNEAPLPDLDKLFDRARAARGRFVGRWDGCEPTALAEFAKYRSPTKVTGRYRGPNIVDHLPATVDRRWIPEELFGPGTVTMMENWMYVNYPSPSGRTLGTRHHGVSAVPKAEWINRGFDPSVDGMKVDPAEIARVFKRSP